MSVKKLVLFGTTEVARLAFHYFTTEGKYQVHAFTVDPEYLDGATLLGLPVVPADTLRETFPPEETMMFVGISYGRMNQNRAEVYDRLRNWGYQFASYIDPKASVLTQAIGENVLIGGNVAIQNAASIGNNVIIGPNVVISHDSIIKDHNYIAPAACLCGENVVDEYCIIGANAVIGPRVHIGRSNFIGIGAHIFHSTGENEAYLTGTTNKSTQSAAFHERFSRSKPGS